MNFIKSSALLILVFITFSDALAKQSRCFPRSCWWDQDVVNVAGYPSNSDFLTGTVIAKAYEFGLEGYLSGGTDNFEGSDYVLYQIRDSMLYNSDLAEIVSGAYSYGFQMVNINGFNAYIYSDMFEVLIPRFKDFIEFANNSSGAATAEVTDGLDVFIDDDLYARISLVLEENKGIDTNFDRLIRNVEREISVLRGKTFTYLINYAEIPRGG